MLYFPVTGKAEKEVDLEQYFQGKGTLHCTTKFCNYGKAEGAKEYVQNPVRNLSFHCLLIESDGCVFVGVFVYFLH